MKSSTLNKATVASLLLLTLSAVQADETQQADQFSGNVSGFLGQKTLDDNDWQKHDDQGAIGVIFDFKKESWPVSIATDLIVSGNVEESGTVEDMAGTVEAHLGVRKIFELSDSSFQPYIGGGIAFVSAGTERQDSGKTTSKSDDSGTGYWVGTGVYYAVNSHFNIGLDVRYSDADVTLFDVKRKAGGTYSGITAGYHW